MFSACSCDNSGPGKFWRGFVDVILSYQDSTGPSGGNQILEEVVITGLMYKVADIDNKEQLKESQLNAQRSQRQRLLPLAPHQFAGYVDILLRRDVGREPRHALRRCMPANPNWRPARAKCLARTIHLTSIYCPPLASRCSVKSAIKRLVDFVPFCLIDKQEIQSVFDEDNVVKRNRENYEQHVRFCNPSSTGVKGNSCLNSLQYFHVTENTCVDIMHDVLEGVAPLEVKLLLRHFIYEEKLFTLEQLNDRIAGFDYGYMNDKNKPSAIINLRSSENALWYMRFEAKHNPMKRQAHVVCNFKNIAKTLAYKHQVQQMYNFKLGDPFCKKYNVDNAFPVNIGALKKAVVILEGLKSALHTDFTMSSIKYVTHSLTVNGQTYRTGSVLPLKTQHQGKHLFGEIIHVIRQGEAFLFLIRVLEVKYFDEDFYAYVVQKTKDFEMINLDDVADVRPLGIMSNFSTVRYKIL
ncbi:hypothetical protein F2P81_018453 [Scophthalmus maximus]|uniref:Uncharacterized protein n=1 Tax=Scophthalmus maximus TaxID=52904 RepID=A0A6A4SAR0_SCOMX|nr:hypothetical protein F2P81_018453 [Scophthalmus maximus]